MVESLLKAPPKQGDPESVARMLMKQMDHYISQKIAGIDKIVRTSWL